jgi:hypothetical protein
VKTHIVRVVLGPSKNGVTPVGLKGDKHRSYYEDHEAPSAGVFAALQAAADAVGRGEVQADDGLIVRVEIKRAPRRGAKP